MLGKFKDYFFQIESWSSVFVLGSDSVGQYRQVLKRLQKVTTHLKTKEGSHLQTTGAAKEATGGYQSKSRETVPAGIIRKKKKKRNPNTK